METGFNFVEVPGSKSRKVAGKKQQWYRTAVLKIFLEYYNILHFSTFHNNVPVNFDVWDPKLFPASLLQTGKVNNLIFLTDLKRNLYSVLNFKKQLVFSFSVKQSYRLNLIFLQYILLGKRFFSSAVFPDMIAINFKNR